MAALISKDDFRRIRLSLALALVMVAGGGAIAFGSTRLLETERKANREALAKRSEIQGRLSRAREEEQEIKQKIARFNALQARGIIGEEQRLDWVELIRQIRSARKLYDIQYEIAPQRPLEGAGTAAGTGGGYDFLASTMRLQMPLLHEEDLLNFLSDLRTSARAYIRPRDCVVERVPKGPSERGGAMPQLKAECSIDWITIREKKEA
ncbi:MAG: hypothetical protein C0522_03450 [Rhodocyclaceae bacterium]|jgi:hypothetical protein|nr:hypothetical protein [Rhodocyclaceae bacterium]